MRLVLDTNVVVSGVRSRTGASNPLLVEGFRRRFTWCCFPALFYEYEDVLGRADLLLDIGMTRSESHRLLDAIARVVVPVERRFMTRPQLPDAKDEMVLEAAVNGRADAIVTHNLRDFGAAPGRYGIECVGPAPILGRLER